MLIVGDSFGFPEGAGASSRVRAWAGGLLGHGVQVGVLCLKTSEPKRATALNVEPEGEHAGVPFRYAPGSTVRASTFAGRRWLEVKGALRGFASVAFAGRTERPDAVVYYSPESLGFPIVMWAAAVVARASFVGEKTELPFVYRTPGLRTVVARWLCDHLVYKLFRGFIVISSTLEEYFGPRLRRGGRLLRVPAMCDVGAVRAIVEVSDAREGRAVYCGNLGHRREIESLLRVLAAVRRTGLALTLAVVGGGREHASVDDVRSLAVQLGVAEDVTFTGPLAHDKALRAIASAEVLLLPRPSEAYSAAGFPTKLAEYLATGIPVVATAVGDVGDFLEDGVSAYLVSPGDEVAFVAAVRRVLANPEEARQVGLHGRAVAEASFDAGANALRLLDLVASLRPVSA